MYSLVDPFKREPKNIFLGDFRRCRSDGGAGFVVVFDGTRVESVTVSVEEGRREALFGVSPRLKAGGWGLVQYVQHSYAVRCALLCFTKGLWSLLVLIA